VAATTTACPLGVVAPTTGRPRLSSSQTAVPVAPTANSTAPMTNQRFILWPLTRSLRFHPATNEGRPAVAHRRETLYPHCPSKNPYINRSSAHARIQRTISRHGEVWDYRGCVRLSRPSPITAPCTHRPRSWLPVTQYQRVLGVDAIAQLSFTAPTGLGYPRGHGRIVDDRARPCDGYGRLWLRRRQPGFGAPEPRVLGTVV
jgi:hypothetical protein